MSGPPAVVPKPVSHHPDWRQLAPTQVRLPLLCSVSMSSEHEQFLAGITALETQRALLGDAVVDASIAALRSKLLGLTTTQAAGPAPSLRQVSVLFLDVVGSTKLSQHLDPEEIHAVMDGALARCTAVVQAHHGKVLQYAGDSLLAAFGAIEAKEDDAERAVRCGLALLAEGRALGAEVQTTHAHAGFHVRVGIHTGGVLLGGGVDAEGTIRGIAVNIAARMEQTAPAGALRISHDTYAQVRGIFDVEPQDPITVKGVDAPIQSYLVQRAKARAFRIASRGIEGVATRMIGREAQLEFLRDAFKRLFVERRLAAFTVMAEAGLGKSRLLTEFETWAEAQPESFFLFRGRANPNSEAQPYGLLRDILAWRLQIADDDTLEVAKAKLEQGIVPLFVHNDSEDVAEGHAHLLGHLLGIDYSASRHVRGILDDPRQIRNRAFHAAAQVFRWVSASDGSPIVLQLEDLHWADDASLDFLIYLTQVNCDVPMLILALARPTLFERREDWISTEGFHRRIDLAPLDTTGSRLLANEILQKLPEIPTGLRDLITGSAEGNPFYMEELVKMLIDQGALDTGGMHSQHWTLHADRLRATAVPSTLTGVLQARLDRLPAPQKKVLQEASVIGQVFWDTALFALDERARALLPALVQREFTLPRADAALDGLREYAFCHKILHQVTYDTVLKRTRCELHGKVAHWLSGLAGVRARDFLGVTAEHYDKAGDAANASEYHARAAEHAKDRFAHDSALHHVQRALALLDRVLLDTTGPDHEMVSPPVATLRLRWRLLNVRERTLDMQGRRSEQRADIDALERLADALDDDHQRAHVAWRRSSIAMRTADWEACERDARRTMSLAERAGDHALRLFGQRQLASALTSSGNPESGRAVAQQGLTEARERGLRPNEASFLNTLSVIASHQDDLMGLLELTRQALAIDRETGNRRSEAITLGTLGASWLALGDHVSAKRDLEEGLRLVRINGDRAQECTPLVNLSQLALWQGDDARALALARSALDTAVAAQARDWEAVALLYIGHSEHALGRQATAGQAYEQARARALEIGHPLQHGATAGLARVALSQGEIGAALEHVEMLLSHLANGGTLEGAESQRFIEMTCYLVLVRAADARAAKWLERAHAHLMARATTIPDAAMRHGFLNNIKEHREIVAAWVAGRRSADQGLGRSGPT